jgi:hypothetical protein
MSDREIKSIIHEALSGEALKNALEFTEFLKANEAVAGGEHGEVAYKGKALCYMHFGGEEEPGPWTVWTVGDYSGEGVSLDERLKKIAHENVNICASCGCDCSPGSKKIIFGKEFDKVCGGAVMAFHMPNAEESECIKKLLAMRMSDISNGRVE